MPKTVKIEIEGEAREIELGDEQVAALAQGYIEESGEYVPVQRHNAEMSKLRKQMKGLVSREDLLQDEDFAVEAASQHRDKVVEVLEIKPQLSDEELGKILGPRIDAATKPLKEENERLAVENAALRDAKLNETLERACREAGVRTELFDPVRDWLGKRVRWDDDHRDYFVVDEQGEFEYSANPAKGAAPYKTAVEFLQEQASHETRKNWFDSKTREGIGYRGRQRPGEEPEKPLDEQIADAEAKRDYVAAAELKQRKLEEYRKKSGLG